MRNDYLELHISPSEKGLEEGLTVKQFLRGNLRFSAHQISRIKYRPAGILLNGAPCRVNAGLRANDVLRIRLDDPPRSDISPPAENDEINAFAENDLTPDEKSASARSGPAPIENGASPENRPVPSLLYEDDYLLIADKPAGMVSHPSHGHHGDSALDLLAAECGRLYLIGRLDKDTSGVLLFAKHLETASFLTRARNCGEVEKRYLARIRGSITPSVGTICAPIGVAQEFPLKMHVDAERGKSAVTHYRTVYSDSSCSILSVQIEHGRTHQIRVHLSSLGHPLEGDALYGTQEVPEAIPGAMPRQPNVDPKPAYACLHAASIHLFHPYTGEELSVSAPLPTWCEGKAR